MGDVVRYVSARKMRRIRRSANRVWRRARRPSLWSRLDVRDKVMVLAMQRAAGNDFRASLESWDINADRIRYVRRTAAGEREHG